jgi:hypothetical protein
MSSLTAIDHCIANLGFHPQPFRDAYNSATAPLAEAARWAQDSWHVASARLAGREPVPRRVRDAFASFDEDGNGTIDSYELKLALQYLGFHLNLDASRKVLEKYDDDGNSTLELEEFHQLVQDFERVAPVQLETAASHAASFRSGRRGSGFMSVQRAERMRRMEMEGKVMQVRRLTLFLEQGITGLTPRGDSALEGRAKSIDGQEAAQFVDFLKELEITVEDSAVVEAPDGSLTRHSQGDRSSTRHSQGDGSSTRHSQGDGSFTRKSQALPPPTQSTSDLAC